VELSEADVDRFWAHVAVGDLFECWPWKASTAKGYGQFKWRRQTLKAHRLPLQPPGAAR
jgi:hypothetical protein